METIQTNPRKTSFIILAVFCFIAIVGWTVYEVIQAKPGTLSRIPKRLVPTEEPGALSPTPFPFAELTIPYLRNRTYTSSLGERTLVADNGTYTSYLTSYTSDDLVINGQLTIPTGEMPKGGWPAVVFVHGYIPPAQYATLEKYIDYVDFIARNGFIVFKIDLRGHGTSEGEPSGAYYSADYVIDTLNAYAALESSGFVNKSKIGLWGHSMAGNVVMRSMAARPAIPAGVIWAGAVYTYTDFLEYRISDASYVPLPSSSPSIGRRQRIIQTNGEITADNPYWQQVAPATFAKDLQGAVQLHHAINDDVVSIEYSRNLKNILDKAEVESEFYEYLSGGHNISDASWIAAMERTVDFYKKHL